MALPSLWRTDSQYSPGRQDSTVGYLGAADLFDHYPRATLVVLDGAGHACPRAARAAGWAAPGVARSHRSKRLSGVWPGNRLVGIGTLCRRPTRQRTAEVEHEVPGGLR